MHSQVETLSTASCISSTSDIDSALRSQEDRHVVRLDLGPRLSRAPHTVQTLSLDAQQLVLVAAKFPNVDDGAILAHDVYWRLVWLPVPAPAASSSQSRGWLAIFYGPGAVPIHPYPPQHCTTTVIAPIGLVTRSTTIPTQPVRRSIQVLELVRDAQVVPQAVAAESPELAFYGGTWEQLDVFGEVMDRVGGWVHRLSLCWRNLSGLALRDVPRVCAFFRLNKCSALRSLDIWLPLHLSGQDPVYWRMAAEILTAAKYAPIDHIQLVLDTMAQDMPPAYEELKQGRWDDVKHALLHLSDLRLKTISIASTIADEAVVEEFFGLVMDRLEELRKKGIRIVQSKGPLFTVAGFTAATR